MKKETELLEQKALPHDVETEEAVLSGLMTYNDKFAKYEDLLGVDLFYYAKEQAMYKCIAGVIGDGGITDINSLMGYVRSHDVGYELMADDFIKLMSWLNKMTLEQDIMRLHEMAKRRECWRMLYQSATRMLDLTNDFEDEIAKTREQFGRISDNYGTDEVSDMDDAFKAVREIVNENAKGITSYLQTGFELFDKKFLLRPDTLTIIAAFTSVGKSALAMNIVTEVAKQGVPCAYYSLEMGKAELAARMISKDMELPASVIMNRKLNEKQLLSFDVATGAKKGLPIYFDDRSTVDFDKTMRSIRKMVKTKGVRLAVIDYLQIYAQVSDDAEESISYMARTAKNVAKELHIPIIVISQLNRSALHPSIKMLRGSGQIEESADNVVLIDRPEAYPDNKVNKYEGEFKEYPIKDTAKLILAKGRGVGTGCELVSFEGKYTRFYERKQAQTEEYKDQQEDLPF